MHPSTVFQHLKRSDFAFGAKTSPIVWATPTLQDHLKKFNIYDLLSPLTEKQFFLKFPPLSFFF